MGWLLVVILGVDLGGWFCVFFMLLWWGVFCIVIWMSLLFLWYYVLRFVIVLFRLVWNCLMFRVSVVLLLIILLFIWVYCLGIFIIIIWISRWLLLSCLLSMKVMLRVFCVCLKGGVWWWMIRFFIWKCYWLWCGVIVFFIVILSICWKVIWSWWCVIVFLFSVVWLMLRWFIGVLLRLVFCGWMRFSWRFWFLMFGLFLFFGCVFFVLFLILMVILVRCNCVVVFIRCWCWRVGISRCRFRMWWMGFLSGFMCCFDCVGFFLVFVGCGCCGGGRRFWYWGWCWWIGRCCGDFWWSVVVGLCWCCCFVCWVVWWFLLVRCELVFFFWCVVGWLGGCCVWLVGNIWNVGIVCVVW